ncbi:MAG: fibronectin type III domain-containing protein [Eubacterium sp.]|nr:fibronectin type III domain-containing protein [Eubacterium sp.]
MKRIIAIITSLIIAVCAFPFSASADDLIGNANALALNSGGVYTFAYEKSADSLCAWFTFTPEADGVYQFNITNALPDKVYRFYSLAYESKSAAEKNENRIEPDGDCYFSGKEYADINPHFFTYPLKKDITYYLDFYTLTAEDCPKSADFSVEVKEHAHSFKDYYRKPIAGEPGDLPEGEYGRTCKVCGYETDIHVFRAPKRAVIKRVTAGKRKITVSWKKVGGAKGYILQYSTNGKFTKNTAVTKTVKGTKAEIKRLKRHKKYYIRVRAFKTVKGHRVYGRRSKVMSAKTK